MPDRLRCRSFVIEPSGSPTAPVTPPSRVSSGLGQTEGVTVRRSIINRISLAAIAGCVAVGALAFAGCGGGSSSSTTTGASGASGTAGSTPLSQDEFVSQANAACKQVNDQVAALKAPAQTLSAQAATIGQEI